MRTLVTSAVLMVACNSGADAAGTSSTGDSTGAENGSSTAPTASVGDPSSATSSGGDSTSSASSDTESFAPCDHPSTCLPAFDDEWQGPVTLRDAIRRSPGCGGDFPVTSTTVYDELIAPPAECTCTCATNGTGSCAEQSSLRRWDDGACVGEEDAEWFVGDVCDSTISAAPQTALHAASIEVEGVTCDPVFETDIDEALFGREYGVCARSGGAQLCESGGICLPDVAAEPICIWREGDFPCPTPWSTTRHLRYREFIDERRCTECTCNEFHALCDGFTISLFGTDGCDEAPVGGVTPGSCESLALQGAAAARRTGTGVFDEPDCSTETVGGVAVGSAGPTSPVSFCCIDP